MKHAYLADLEVARLGLGAMGMSVAYAGAGSDDAEAIRTVHRAIDLGVTLIDTAEVYGPYVNEELLARALWNSAPSSWPGSTNSHLRWALGAPKRR